MALSEDEILSAAGRIRAGRRLRIAKACARCGTSFVGIAQAKYCSDACRMAAARERREPAAPYVPQPVRLEPFLPGESIREYWERLSDGPLSENDEAIVALLERIHGPHMEKDTQVSGDSAELIRRMRDERSAYLASL